MGWAFIFKQIFMLSVKNKVKEASKEEIYAKASYLPFLYFFVAAPTIFLLLGVSLFAVAGLAQLYPAYFFPTDFVLVLASLSLVMSPITFYGYRSFLQNLLMNDNEFVANGKATTIEEKVEGAFAPVVKQFNQEQNLIKEAFMARKNRLASAEAKTEFIERN